MSDVLDYVREKDPRFKDVADEDLTLFLGSKKPDFLQDPGFKEEFVKAAGQKSLNLALKGTGDVLKIITNPAVAEASAMGQEQAQAQRLEAGLNLASSATSKVMGMIEKGAIAAPTADELAAQKEEIKFREDLQKMGPAAALAAVKGRQTKQAGEGVGVLTTPIAEIFPKITGDQMEKMLGLISTSMPMAIARERAVGASPEDREKEPGMHPEKLLTPEARNLVRGVAGVEQSLADQANFFTSPLGIATLGIGALPAPIAKLVGIGFTAQMASQLPGHSKAINEELDQPEPDYEKIFKTTTDAVGALGFTIAGGLHLFEPVIRAARARAAYTKALKEAFPVAPATTGALSSQIGSEYMGAGPFLPPTRIPEAPARPVGETAATGTPQTPEKPQGAPSQSLSATKLRELGWTIQQIAALKPSDRIKAAMENRPPPAESAEPPPVEPEDETLASAERTRIKEKGPSDAGSKVQESKAGEIPTEQRKPTEQQTEGQAEGGTSLGGSEDKGQKTVTPRETINNVVGGDQAAFAAAVGKEGQQVHAQKTGASITDQADLDYLYDQQKNLKTQSENLDKLIKEAKKAKNNEQLMSLLQDRAQIGWKQQWVNEAIEGATGSPDAAKTGILKKVLGEDFTPKFPPKHPDLPEKGKGGKDIFKVYAEATARWAQQVNNWVKSKPENKALIFQKEHTTYAVTKDPSGKWRYTVFDNDDHMPVSHQEFKTREEAVQDVLRGGDAKVLDKMPFAVEPMPVHAFPGDTVTWRKPGGEAVPVEFRGYSKEAGKAFIKDPETGESRTVDSMELGPKPKPVAETIQKDIAEKKNQSEATKDFPEVTAPEAPKAPETPKPTEAEQEAKDKKRREVEDAIFEQEKRILKEGGKDELARIQNDAIRRGVAESESYLKELEAWKPKPKGRTANAIRADIRKTEKNIKTLQSAKRGYDKAKAKGPAARTQDKIREAQNKLTDLQQELAAADPQADKRVGQAMRRFNEETKKFGDDILSFINETGKLMSWSQFVEAAKTKGEEWFNKNKSLYDDIRNTKLPPHINAAIFGGENLPDTVAQDAFRDKKLPEAHERALWAEIKDAVKKRKGSAKGETAEERQIAQEEKYQVWKEATGPGEGRTEIDPQIIAPGERYMLDGQELKVTGRDTDTGFVTIDGGEKFGEIKLRDNEPFWVDAVVETGAESTEFLPPEEEAAPPAAEAPKPAEQPKKGTGGELFAAEDIPFNLMGEEQRGGTAEKPKTAAAEQTDLLGGAAPKAEEPALEKPKVEERPLTEAEQEEFLELSRKYRKNREEGGEPLTTAETQRYEYLTALAGQKDFGFAEPTGPEAIKGKIKALASAIDNLDKNAPQGSGKKRQQYVEQRDKLYREMRDLMDKLTEGQGELVFTSDPKEMPSGYYSRKQFRVRQLTDEEVQDRWRNPSERMEVFKVAGTRPYVAESRRIDFDDAAGTKEAGRGNWYAEGYGKTRDGAIGDARSRKGSAWSKIPEEALQSKPAEPAVESKVPESAQKYRIGNNPTLYTLVERLDQSPAEKANNEQPVRVRNENTGKEEIVLESELKPVKERSAAEKAKSKGKRDLDQELRDLGLDPTVFKTKAEKQAAIIRENQKKQGPGTPHITQPADPKANIDQLEEAFRNVRGRRVPISERVKAMFDLGKKIAAAKDIITETTAGLKTVGDYLIGKWSGYPNLTELLKAKGELSAEIEANGWRMKHFVKTIERAVPDPMQRAAIAKWVDAGGDMERLIAGYEEAPDRFKQHYLDAMDLNGDLLVGAMNIRNYFDARLQEAIDAGVLKEGVEDYIHRIYEKTPALEKQMLGYLQTGLLRMNPALAKHRIFDHDWEAEKAGYNVVQDFLPRITEYEAALSRAIASRKFVRKIIGYEDQLGNKVPAMLAEDGRPIIDVAGVGIPLEDQAGVPEGTLIKPSARAKMKQTTEIDPNTGQPVTTEDPLTNREDYEARNQYGVFRKWKWVVNDAAGNPVYVQGDVIIHPDYVRKFDALLEPSKIRYAKNPALRFLGRAALGVGGFVKQSMLDLSGFHQVQMAIHGAEHRVYTLPGEVPIGMKQLGFEKVLQDIDLTDPRVDGLLKGGLTLGGDYRYSREGLAGRSITRLIPGLSEAMESYHQYLFQDFIPRVKTTMALEALERNGKAYASDLQSGRMTQEQLFAKTANQANAAFGELNQITLERSKTFQDAMRLIFLAPDFLEARGRFALQALQRGPGDVKSLEYWKKGGPITNNEQRMALAYGAMFMWGMARVMNLALDGQMHNEPENLFSVVYKGRAYGLRTVQGDILHLATRPVQFWMSRLNPVFGRTLLEMASGRDYFGRKRSPLEQVWDAVSTLEPASIRHSQEHTLWESMMNAFGVTSRRFSDVDEAFKMAQKWKDKHGVGMKGEFIYDPSKDDLRGLKIALSNGDEGASVKEIQKLVKGGKYSLSKLDTYFDRYSSMPLAGSQANDRKFISGLTEDQKKTVQTAYGMKKSMNKLYRQAKGKYIEATRGPAPKVDESEIDQPTPQVQ